MKLSLHNILVHITKFEYLICLNILDVRFVSNLPNCSVDVTVLLKCQNTLYNTYKLETKMYETSKHSLVLLIKSISSHCTYTGWYQKMLFLCFDLFSHVESSPTRWYHPSGNIICIILYCMCVYLFQLLWP